MLDEELDPYLACMQIVHEIVRGIVRGFVQGAPVISGQCVLSDTN
jgi:hypothetical protein